MERLESNSRCRTCEPAVGAARPRRTKHVRGEVLGRHRHDQDFLAIVLSGRYVEAGDTGRHQVGSGDVIVHRAHESHLNRFEAGPAEVLILPCVAAPDLPTLGHLPDADAIVRLAERDVPGAYDLACRTLIGRSVMAGDWPDTLAGDLARTPDLCLREWASTHGLHPGSLSRGFQQMFGLTPARYRAHAKTQHAIRQIRATSNRLCDIALGSGFADQAHLSRSLRRTIGFSPVEYRRSCREQPAARASVGRHS